MNIEKASNDELLAELRMQMSHVARGCRSGTSHEPAPYVQEHEALLAEIRDRLAAPRTSDPTQVFWTAISCPHGRMGNCPECYAEAATRQHQARHEAFMERLTASIERNTEILERLSR